MNKLRYLIPVGIGLLLLAIIPFINPGEVQHNSRWDPGISESHNILSDLGSIIHNLPGILAVSLFCYLLYKFSKIKWTKPKPVVEEPLPEYTSDDSKQYEDDVNGNWEDYED